MPDFRRFTALTRFTVEAMTQGTLAEDLPPPLRLALAYAPARARGATLAVLALDQRLGGIVRAAREPLLGQVRLAWWRDRLQGPPEQWPMGEPLLAFQQFSRVTGDLVPLVEGWEALLVQDDPALLIEGRALAFAALARALDAAQYAAEAARAGRNWALADLAANLSPEAGQGGVIALLRSQDVRRVTLPRSLRALTVLNALAARISQREVEKMALGPLDFAIMVRTGLFGR